MSVTAAFASDLEDMNAAEAGIQGPMRLHLIAHSIEAGLITFSETDKYLCFKGSRSSG